MRSLLLLNTPVISCSTLNLLATTQNDPQPGYLTNQSFRLNSQILLHLKHILLQNNTEVDAYLPPSTNWCILKTQSR